MNDPDGGPASVRAVESIRRNTAFALGLKVAGAVLTGGLTLFLARYLGPESYGVYALALSIGGLLVQPADFGVSPAAGRFIAERRENPPAAASVLRRALGMKAVGASMIALVLVAAAEPIARAYGVPDLEWPLRIFAVALLAQSFMTLFIATFEALGRNSLSFRLGLSESAVEVIASLALVLAGTGVIGATAGRAVGYSFGVLLGFVLARRALGRPIVRRPAESDLAIRRVARYAGTLFVVDTAYAAFSQIDTLMIGAFLDPRSAGLFSAPVQILALTTYAGGALAAGVTPRLARAPGRKPDVASFQLALRLVLVLQFSLAVTFLVWAQPITDLLLGPNYSESADIFRGLAPFVLLVGPTTLLSLGVNYLGEARRRVPLALAAIAINASIDAVLIPKIGIVGGAIGTDVAYLIFFIGHIVICRRLIDLDLSALGLTALRASLAGIFMAAVLLAFGTSSLGAVELVVGAILGLVAYGLIIVATGEIRAEELARARTALLRLSSGARRDP